MTEPVLGSRRSQVTLALVFVLGLLLGWWVLGWWLVPVTYKNALPQDLRPDAKNQYLTLTADAFSASGDRNLLSQRITDYGWPTDQLANDLSLLQSSLSNNPREQQKVQQMGAALGAASSKPVAPRASPAPESGQSASLLSRLCPGALWLVLILAGVAALAWLWQRWRQTQSRVGAPIGKPIGSQWSGRRRSPSEAVNQDAAGADADLGVDQSETTVDDTGWYSAGSSEPSGHASATGDWSVPGDTAVASTDAAPSSESAPSSSLSFVPPVASPAEKQAGQPATPSTTRTTPVGGIDRETKLSEFTATYHAGEPDYDEAFDIKDANDAVVGQCGLSLMMPVGRGNDQAAALQVWLWEERDQYTQVKVLVSEGAYRDTSLRSQLAEENPALQVRPGVEFDLESYTLRLHGVVEKVSYLDQEPYNQMFEILVTRLQVFQRERA